MIHKSTSRLESYLDSLLAPFAVLHGENGGRIHADDESPYRTCYQRDRDRVIHSKAFRRLGYKTQVFVNSEGDNYRTRLTHSMEVAQISRSVAAALHLNQDYAEAVALAHDLGHTPFGHAGQETLHHLMESHGGFEHNCQSIRIVTEIETRYLYFRGLNLSRSVLKGMMKRSCESLCARDLKELCRERARENPCLEAALVDSCDRIAYLHHDLEDGLDSGYLEFDDLFGMEGWKEAYHRLESEAGESFRSARTPHRIRSVLRKMINGSITDLIETTAASLDSLQLKNREELHSLDSASYPVRHSKEMSEIMGEMQRFLFRNLYRHPAVMKMSRRGSRIIEILYEEYVRNPEVMPSHIQNRIPDVGLHRVVADYISGMTDRYALKEFGYLTGGDVMRL